MTDRTALADRFEADRTRLQVVAHRLLGSHAEAEDAIQEAWLRLGRTDAEAVDNLGARRTTAGYASVMQKSLPSGART